MEKEFIIYGTEIAHGVYRVSANSKEDALRKIDNGEVCFEVQDSEFTPTDIIEK